MKLPLLLALLFGAISALPLSKSPCPLGDDTLPQDGDMPERGAMEAPMEGMMLLEGEEEGGFRSEVVPEEEGLIKSVSALEEVDKDFQCPKEKDTVKLEGIPGWKTCCFIVVMTARTYNQAHHEWPVAEGFLVSIHSHTSNYQIQSSARCVNQSQVWIGGAVRGSVRPVPALREPLLTQVNFISTGVGNKRLKAPSGSAFTGHWRLSHCITALPFVCSF
uniref:Uncharacterized protein n=1 Tax=Equus asinus TaxID=9793 RepID=A0A9L0I6S2_EQUAS